jgi:hypothetical protein
MSISADEWMEASAAGSGITTDELDRRAREYQDAWNKYEKQKAVSTELFKEAERLEGKMVEAMEQAGKKKYFVEGIGTFSFTDKFVVPTPKTIEERKQLFKYIQEKHGEDFFYSTASVNHATLQKLYKTDFDEAVETDPESAATFVIPGLQAPTNMRSLRLTGEKK